MRRKWLYLSLFFLLLTVWLIRFVSQSPLWIEYYYARGVYPWIGKSFRLLTGWIPFSIGDILYLAAIYLIISEIIRWIKWLRLGLVSVKWFPALMKYLQVSLLVYVVFNLFWGLNYNRLSIGAQFQLKRPNYSDTALLELATHLRTKTNESWTPVLDNQSFTPNAFQGYQKLSKTYGFLEPGPRSLKNSMFGTIGNYIGYLGYFNPISGEGQVNKTIPAVMKPFVVCHEMGHQLGYAKEDEASFVGHLAAKASGSKALRYSAYLNMYLSAYRELWYTDSLKAYKHWDGLRPEVQKDIRGYKAYLDKYDSTIGTWVNEFYAQYLRLNEQPEGMRSYSLVVVWLLAWYQTFGTI